MKESKKYSEPQKATYPLSQYPEGSRFFSIGGGYWIKEGDKFRWCSSHCKFPRPGGDWNGTVSVPCGKI